MSQTNTGSVYAKAIGSYSFIQDTPSDTWIITHNLGVLAPVVDCWIDVNGTLTAIIAEAVTVVTANIVQISFSVPRTGTVNVV